MRRVLRVARRSSEHKSRDNSPSDRKLYPVGTCPPFRSLPTTHRSAESTSSEARRVIKSAHKFALNTRRAGERPVVRRGGRAAVEPSPAGRRSGEREFCAAHRHSVRNFFAFEFALGPRENNALRQILLFRTT